MHVSTPKPLVASILCVGGNAQWVDALAVAVPGATVRIVAEAELESSSDAATGIVAICDGTEAMLARVRALNDVIGLPRWAVAGFASQEDAADGKGAAPSLGQPAMIAQILQAALTEQRLRRENAQLRGDLRAFATRVAHDLRTPLGGILTTAEMLREILGQESPGHVGFITPIVDSAEAQAGLIERISLYGKAVSSTAPFEPFDMGSAFWNAYQQLESRIFKAQAVVKHAAQWPTVLGHAPWSEAIWRNLLTNSIQHGGAAVQIEAGWTERADRYEFWLKDSGTVPEGRRPSLFFPFHQLHSPSAPRGLGLPIARRLAELQGGTCGYEPLPDRGSRFYFTLPRP